MSRFLLASSICLVLTTAPVRAELVEVTLPGLAGIYPVNANTRSRTTAVQLPRTPDVIHSIVLVVEGTSEIGYADCSGPGVINKWPMEFIAELTDNEAIESWVTLPPPHYSSGEFYETGEFEPDTGIGTLDFLLDGEASLTLSGGPQRELLSCDPILVPTGRVDDVMLIFDAEFFLGTEPTTWGRVKALYR